MSENIGQTGKEHTKDILFLIIFTLFIICLFGGELILLVYLGKHGYIDRFIDWIP